MSSLAVWKWLWAGTASVAVWLPQYLEVSHDAVFVSSDTAVFIVKVEPMPRHYNRTNLDIPTNAVHLQAHTCHHSALLPMWS